MLTTEHHYEPNWLVASADEAVDVFRSKGGQVISEPFDLPVGRPGLVLDPFGNTLVLLDLSNEEYDTDEADNVTGVS